MDAAGCRSIRQAVEDHDEDLRVVALPFLFYILYDNGETNALEVESEFGAE